MLHFLVCRLVLTAAHCVPDLPAAQSSAFRAAGLNFTSLANTYRPSSGDGKSTRQICMLPNNSRVKAIVF